MIRTISKFLLVFNIAVITGMVFVVPAQAVTEQTYIIQLYSGQKESLLTMIPGLTEITPLVQDKTGETYRFKSTESLPDLQRTFDGFYQSLQPEITYQQAATKIKNFKGTEPDDPGFTENPSNIDRQWGLVKANFIQAWNKTTGDPNIIVAIVDTGIDATHEDFYGTKIVTGYNVLTKQNISGRVNSDDNGHGTLVSGVIAATTDNSRGIAGAAFNLSLMPVKALGSDGSGSSSSISEGIVWAADHGADIINLSLGGIGFAHDTVLADAIKYAFKKDIVIVSAAGNDVAVTGGDLDKDPVFPVCDDNNQNMIIGVTATDSNDLKPDFANYGKACIDVSAPGKRILSTINRDPASGSAAPDAYAYASGTSLAVPFVSAEAGLLRSLFPSANNKQIRDRIITTAENIDSLNLSQCGGHSCAGLLGGGRINAAKSLEDQFPSLKDGDLVQIKNTELYYYINGGKKQLVSPFVRNQRFIGYVPIMVSAVDLQDFPEGSYAAPLDGTLVKIPNDPTVYQIQSGLRRPLTYQVFSMRGFRFSEIVTLTNVEVGSWVMGSFLAPPDGSLIRSPKNTTVYWVVSGTLHAINFKFYKDRGLNIFPVMYCSDGDIAKFPHGDPYILN